MQIKYFLKFFLLLVCLFLLSWYVWGNRTEFLKVFEYPSYYVGFIFLSYFVFFVLNSLILVVAVRDYGFSCSFFWGVRVSVFSSLLSYIGFLKIGAIGYKTYALAKEKNMGFSSAFGVVFLALYFSILINGIFFVVGLWMEKAIDGWLWLCALAAILGFVLLPFLVVGLGQSFPSLKRFLGPFLKIKISSPKVYIIYFLLFSAQFLVGAFITHLLFSGIRESVDFSKSIIVSAVSGLSLVVALTPGNLGVREMLYLMMGTVLNIEGTVMVAISLVDRVIQFISVISMSVVAFLVNKVFFKKFDNDF